MAIIPNILPNLYDFPNISKYLIYFQTKSFCDFLPDTHMSSFVLAEYCLASSDIPAIFSSELATCNLILMDQLTVYLFAIKC